MYFVFHKNFPKYMNSTWKYIIKNYVRLHEHSHNSGLNYLNVDTHITGQ